MFQEPVTVPEELYNLTQLADVTLAAGKLSTTNIVKIKEYIGHGHRPQHPAADGVDYCNKKKRWHTVWKSTESTPDEHDTTNNTSTIVDTKNHSAMRKPPTAVDGGGGSGGTSDSGLSSSSEDDSCTYNYSHKIFDKRKSRKLSMQSDSSEYCANATSGHLLSRSSTVQSAESETEIGGGDDENGEGGLLMAKCENGGNTSSCDDVHICPECGKKYSTSSNLARHRQTHRSLQDKKARRCPHCDKIYVSMPAFSMHVRTHNQGCECPHCGKCFSRPWLLQGHIRTHTGEKPFKCPTCNKAFADKSNLRAHIQTHSNMKPHTCNRCGKSFALKSYLYKHEESSCMKNHHSPSSEKPRRRSSHSSCKDGHSRISTETDEEQIITEEVSQKSYINLANRSAGNQTRSFENCSRISVIRSAAATATVSSAAADFSDTAMNFYQEQPVDFSPKGTAAPRIASNNHFELASSYALVA